MAQEEKQNEPSDLGLDGLNGSMQEDYPTQKKSVSLPSQAVMAIGGLIAGISVILVIVWWLLGSRGVIGLVVMVLVITVGVWLSVVRRAKRLRNEQEQADQETAQAEQRAQREAEEMSRLEQLATERVDRRENMVELANNRRRSMAIFVANQAGSGSKTTTCAYMALTFREVLKAVPVIIVECRRDSAQGVDNHKLSNEKVVTIREFHEKLKNGDLNGPNGSLSNELIMEQLVFSQNGIYYLQADVLTPMNDTFGGRESSEVVAALKTTGAIIVVDSGNNPSDEITIGMADECALGVFPTMPSTKSFTLWRRTLDTFDLHVSSGITSNCVSVLSAVEPGQDLELLKSKMGTLPGGANFYYTHYDPYMKDDVVSTEQNDGTKVVDLTKIMPENRDTFEHICERLLEMFVLQGEGSDSSRNPIPLRPAQSNPS